MTIVLGTLQLGILYGLLAIGIYISFRILNTPDLTAEGSFTFGLSVSAVVASAGHPYLALVLGMLAGALAGAVTGILQTKCKIRPVLAGILTMSALYSINMFVMGAKANVTLIGVKTVFTDAVLAFSALNKEIIKLMVIIAFTAVFAAILIIFFKTHTGLCIRAAGDNETMVRASSINGDAVRVIALCISNAFIALNGALIAQYQCFADINSGVGILVVGLASVIIGEVIFGKRSVTIGIICAVVGSLIYRTIIAIATDLNLLPAYMLKLISAVIVAIALTVPAIKAAVRRSKVKKGGAR